MQVCNSNDWTGMNLCNANTNNEIGSVRIGELVANGLYYADWTGAGLSIPADEIETSL